MPLRKALLEAYHTHTQQCIINVISGNNARARNGGQRILSYIARLVEDS